MTKKYDRSTRRDINNINVYFDKLMDIYIHERVRLPKPMVEKLYMKLDARWRAYAKKHNGNKKHRVFAEEDAFKKQVEGREELHRNIDNAIRRQREQKVYQIWQKKMELCYPWTLKRYRLSNMLRNLFRKGETDYVKEKFKKLKGKSPGSKGWL